MKQVGTHFTLLVVAFCLTAIALNWGAEQEEDAMNVWDAFLNTLENRGLASSDWEIEPDVQAEFIKENQLPWRQIFDGGGFRGTLVEQYGVRSIPAPFLLDREGKVISVNARGYLLGELVEVEIERKID